MLVLPHNSLLDMLCMCTSSVMLRMYHISSTQIIPSQIKFALCCVWFVLLKFFLINTPWSKKKGPNLSVKQKLELFEKLESGVYITCVYEEYGHLDIMAIWQ
jgi:hypothetical protein